MFPQAQTGFATWDAGAILSWSPNDILVANGSVHDYQMDLEVRTRLGIRKHDGAQRRAVEMSVGRQDRRAETLHQALERRLPGFDHIARQLIGVDDGHA